MIISILIIIGSSAGAGSEVFHVYRHLRRYESIRQDWIKETAEKEDKDAEFQMRLAEKRAAAEQKTAKKRAKRYTIIYSYIYSHVSFTSIIFVFRLKKKQLKGKKILLDKKKETGGDIVEQDEREESDNEDDEDDDAYENPFVIGGK